MTGYGYQIKNLKIPTNGSFVGPTDTLRLAFADSGAIASKNGTMYAFNGRFWTAAVGFDTTGIRYRPTAGDGISITGSYPSQTISANPDTVAAGSLINITPSGTKTVTISVDSLTLAALYGGKVDSVVKRGDTLREFASGDSTLIGTVSGGGGTGTLQEAFDKSVAEDPTIYFYNNPLKFFGRGFYQVASSNSDSTITSTTYIDGNDPNGLAALAVYDNSGQASSEFIARRDSLYIRNFSFEYDARIEMKSNVVKIYDALSNNLNVGINTTTPTAPLHVVGGIKADSIQLGVGPWVTSISGSTDTTSLSNRINAKANTASPTFTGTVTTPMLQVTGRTSLQGVNVNKDSLPVTTTNRWALTVDTPTNRLQRYDLENKADTSNQTFTGRNTFTSTTSGVIIPRVTTAQMNAISSPTAGEIVYNTDEGATFYYTTDWGWMSDAPEWKRRSGVEYFSEFIVQPTATNMQTEFFTTILANSGTIGSATAVSNRPGIYQFSTSTSSNARSSIVADATNATNVLLGGGQLMYETDVQIPTLSNSTETFRFFVGLSNNTQVASATSVAFLYDSAGVTMGSAATGNWQVVCANAGTRSYTTTSVPVVAGQWYRLKAVVNAAATQVQFFIDGNPVRTETNNIPTTGVTPMAVLTKSNGTTARTALIDWFFFKQKFTTQR